MAKRSFLQLQEVIDLKRPKVGNVEPDDDFRAKMCVCSAIAAVIGSFKLDRQRASSERSANTPRDRAQVKMKIMTMKPATFKRNYRLDRDSFMSLLSEIRNDLEPHPGQVREENNVDPMIQLAVCLRMLAGGSYLDISFGYDVGHSSVYTIFKKVLEAIDKRVDNIKFPYKSEEELKKLEETFAKISRGAMRGTVAAGDGIVFRTTKPSVADVDGNVRSFYCRKGFYGHALQAFCDGNCKFVHISQKVCASTHDGTAYVVSGMSNIIEQGKLPTWAHIVLDEAYKCTEQELSPWKGENLSPEKDTFNYYLSLHRQVIERAFGLLLARWGIFWRPLRFGTADINLIVRVCCKLHNICVDVFGANKCSVEVSQLDKVWEKGSDPGADSTLLWTDGTNGRAQGQRSDLLATRVRITSHLNHLGLKRPLHSEAKKLLRI